MESPPQSDADDRTDAIGRRSALAVIFGGAAAISAGAVTLVAGFLANALGRTQENPWIRIGPAEDLDAETFRPYVIHVDRLHGWIQTRVPLSVYIKDLYPADPIALSSRCTHLGCAVRWNGEGKQFKCPCHGGTYDEKGGVVSGPPPAPLTQLEVKIDDDEVCHVRLPTLPRSERA